ncbi:epoxyqueuosine reductase [bacterium 210820-DFI.6.37]|nr:epoxyqueuosine reductase [bacterium 210820-DFI.6.37]
MREYLTDQIKAFLRDYEKNTVTKWGDPLVGFADAKKVKTLTSVVSPSHGAPEDAVKASTIVLAYFIPFQKELAQTNTKKGLASPQWAQSYEETNAMFIKLNAFLVERLKRKGYQAAVPPEAGSFDREKLISNWSQRHIAYLAGLGSFGLNNMLITKAGCCGRISTIVTDLDVPPDEPIKEELCMYKKNGTCGLCADRCPSGALTREGYDRHKCYAVCLENARVHNGYGNSYASEAGGEIQDTGSEVCGKCVAGMPCAFR